MLDKDLIPMRWPDNPGWQKPEMVGLVSQETPVNCLITPREWPLKEVAEKRGMRVMTLSEDQSVPVAKVKSGQTGIVAISDGTWPSIPAQNNDGGGPTGNAWIESNGWRIRLAHTKAPQATVWVDAAPPKDRNVRPEFIALAVADANAYGARWIVDLPVDVVQGLAIMSQDARRAGQVLARALRFFEIHKGWSEYQGAGKVAVVSDFDGPNEFFGTEVLNLAPRRQLPYRILDKGNAPDLTGVKAVLWVDQKAPADKWAAAVNAFVQEGGILVVAASNAHLAKGLASAGNFDNRYDLFSRGKGRIAVARKPWGDPYELTADVHLILGRREDVIRLWNGSSTNLYLTESGGKALVHVLNYAVRTMGSPLSLWVARQYKTARWFDMVADEPRQLELVRRNDGVEVAIPDFLAYGAVELGEA